MSDEANSTDTKESAPAPGPAATPVQRTRAFAQGLLTRLPALAVTRWEAKDAMNVHERLKDVTDLDADAFLRPLEPASKRSHD